MAAINLDIGGNTRQLDRDIQKTVNRVYSINLKTKGDQPLGRITGKVNEFTKSLDASNARVIAFGASAGIIFGLERAFTALVSSTIEVQKSLQDINVILNVSTQQLSKFGGELFSIARNTGQSFQEVAKAATEFSRQGLGVEETLKRTNEALILSRLSGLDAAKSVEALTAAVNSFASQSVTATEIVNKFATVDAAFAVSSADLADAIARVGSSAAQSGVSLNELIAIVTSAQQTTARGGAVIGNSFKTIFTRLQRGKVVDLLESLGISSTDSSGQVKSTIQLLQDLGSVYDKLGSQQQAYVAEQVGGVFQINILKAALADLGKEYSIYGSALNVAAGATDQAIRRNEELNKTYAAQINALQENARQLAAAGGERLLGPTIDRLVGGTNALLSGFNESDGQNVGTVLGKGILDGIGQFIAGPGLALIGGVLLKLFRDLAKFATGSVQQLLGLNTAATQQRDLQASIQQILSKNPQLLELALKGEQGLNTAANSLLASLQKQTVELQKQAQVAQQISKAFVSQAGVRVAGGVPVVPTGKTAKPGKAGGYIPNFSAEVFNAREFGASKNVRETKNIGTIGGKPFQPNNEEIQIPNMFGTGDTGVIPKYGNGIKEAEKMIARGESGSILDKSDRNRARGFVPNFSNNKTTFKGGVIKPKPSQSSLVADGGLDRYTSFSLSNDLVSSRTSLENKFQKELNLLNNKDPFVAGRAARFFERNGLKPSEINQLKINVAERDNAQKLGKTLTDVRSLSVKTPDKLVNINRQFASVQNNVLGKSLFEKLSARKLGLVQNPNKSGRLDLLNKGGKPVSEVKFGAFREDNIISKIIETDFGRKYLNDTPQKIKMPSNYRLAVPGKASGFIPNFAKASKEQAIDLGDISTNPSYKGKLLSVIIPQPTKKLLKFPARAKYGDTTYTTTGLPVSGPNREVTKKLSQQDIPNLHRNVGKVVLDQANVFGRSLGATKFMSSVGELPNLGGVKSAAGVAFEGGVMNALGLSVGSGNARVDFKSKSLNPKFKRIFNNAPGSYEAKNRPSPELINDGFSKFLRGARPTGPGKRKLTAKEKIDERSTVVAAFREKEALKNNGIEPNSRQINSYLTKNFPYLRSAGFIPNFAPFKFPTAGESRDKVGIGQFKGSQNDPMREGYYQYVLGASKREIRSIWGLKNETKKEKRVGEIEEYRRRKGVFNKLKNYKGSPGLNPELASSIEFYRNKSAFEYDASGRMQLYESNGFLNARNVRQHEYTGSESNAISIENDKIVLEDFNPAESKKVKFNSKFRPGVNAIASALGMGITTRSALTNKLATSRVAMIRNNPLYKASGFIPNFATTSDNALKEAAAPAMALENAMAPKGKKASFYKKPIPHVRYQSTFSKAMADHGGKNQAIKDSMMSQQKAGIIKSSGFIPNFAIEDPDVQAAGLGSSIGAVVAQLGFLAFSLQGITGDYKNNIEQTIEKNRQLNSSQIESINTQQKSVEQNKKNIAEQRRSGEISKQTARLKFDELKIQQATLKGQAAGLGAPSKGQQLGAGLQSAGFALSLGAPIIAETIKNAIGQETSGARRAGDVVSGVGQIASFAGVGATFGPWGAAIGAATGAMLTVPGIIKSFLTDFPELERAAQKAAQEVTKFGDSSSRVIQASEAYAAVLKNSQSSAETINKAQQALAQALDEVPAQYRDQVAAAAGEGRISEVTAEIQKKLLKEADVKAGAAQLEKSTGEAKFQNVANISAKAFKATDITGISRVIDSVSKLTTGKSIEGNIFGEAKDTIGGKENVQATERILKQALTGGEFTPETVKELQKISNVATTAQLTGAGATPAAKEGSIEVKNVDDFRKFLESTGKIDPTNIEEFVEQAQQGPEAFEQTVFNVNQSIGLITREAQLTVESLKKAAAEQKEYIKNVDAAKSAIDAATSSLQKNVAISNLFKSALENIGENIKAFSENLRIEQELTQPRQTLENIIGADKTPVRRLAAQEGLAGIQEEQRAATSGATINFKESVRGILEKPFQENFQKLSTDLGTTPEGFKGDSGEILTQTKDVINKTTEGYQNLDSTMKNVEGLMSKFVSGQISTQQLLEQSRAALSSVGIDVSRGSQASDQIEKAVAELQVKSVQEQVKAFQQRAKLASETKQAILQSRIDAALNTFGGFEGFMNRPQEEGNYIQRIAPDLAKIQEMRGSPTFRYNNKEAIQEQQKQAPELGRSFANVYKELINQSGGAFRDFLQQTIDQGIQQTGVEGRSGLAGAGLAGGFDDIVRGRQQDLEQQLKLAEDQIKVTTDPALKRDLQGFVNSVKNIPGGTKGIAQLQTQKELGVARQSDFAKLYGKYENEALNRLKDISPELAASLESSISLSDDPLIAEAQLQSQLQGEMIGYLGPIQSAILQIASSGGGSVVGTGVPQMAIEAYKPKLTEEQQKKANEIKKQADAKVQQAQQAAIPQSNRTIAEIEAETTAKRNKAREAGMTLEEYTKQVQGPVMGPQVSPDYAKYQELNKPGQTFKSQDEMMTNFLQRLNFKETGKILSQEQLGLEKKAGQTLATEGQSFAQQEAALSSNTSALTTLNGGIQNLNSTLANFETNFSNLNNIPGTQAGGNPARPGVQPNISTNTNVPLTIVVNADGQTDIATAIGQEIQKKIPEIVDKVRIARGEKVPPTVPKP